MRKLQKQMIISFSCLLLSLLVVALFALFTYLRDDKFLFEITDGEAILKEYRGEDESVIIPEKANIYKVTEIGEEAFKGNEIIKSVLIPGSVKKINKNAFNSCKELSSVTIEKGAWLIGVAAFNLCSNLRYVSMGDTVKTISYDAFRFCQNLKSIDFGKSVRSIGVDAFAACSKLASIKLPKTIEVIEYRAFAFCESLSVVYYEGTEEDWNNIYIDDVGSHNEDLLTATRYYYSETQPTEDGNYWHYVGGEVTKW